jgi:hypothetical protein
MKRRLHIPTCLLLLLAAALAALAADPGPATEEFFETRIRPVLLESCFACHGGKETEQGLRVDSREALLKGGKSGPAMAAGEADKSLLMQAIRRTHEAVPMPPDKPLPASVVKDFAAWITAGAPWPKFDPTAAGDPAFQVSSHWSFRPVAKVLPPEDPSGWASHPIDRFIAEQWQRRSLHPVAAANRRTLARRLYFDLIGLPPTPEEIESFVADQSPDAFEQLVDRLLASPAYGERWGRYWMDVVRYADTAGDNADYPVPEAQLYRDYIVDSFNSDKPYEQFVREQLAGDLLAAESPPEKFAEQTVATGFLALSRRYATAPYELWYLTLEDTVDTVGQTFLGLTLRCARCHDHKFDPIATDDYYALYGIFESTQFPWAGGEEFQSKNFPRQHFVPLLPAAEVAVQQAAYKERLDKLAGEIAELDKQIAAANDEQKKGLQPQLAQRRDEQLQLQRPGVPPGVPGAYAVREGSPHNAAIQRKGDPTQAGPAVARGSLAFFSKQPLDIPANESGRRQLADWLTRPDQPLPARVMVNRIWQHHFGRGLVATPSNFGLRGARPTHPQLLDYLARRFVESGWSIKAMQRLIVTSQTWQLSCNEDPQNAAIDTGNVTLWRHDRLRLDAEAYRDALLAVSGRLDPRLPPPHPFPAIRDWHWTQHAPFKDVYPTQHRSVYLMTQRLQKHPFLALFDGPDTNTTTEKRSSSTVPPQALFLMNSPEAKACAESFADRLLTSASNDAERIELAYQFCCNRRPTSDETAHSEAYLQSYELELSKLQGQSNPRREAWISLARALLAANEFCYIE